MNMKTAYQQPRTYIVRLTIQPLMLGGSVGVSDMDANPTLPGFGARSSHSEWDDDDE